LPMRVGMKTAGSTRRKISLFTSAALGHGDDHLSNETYMRL